MSLICRYTGHCRTFYSVAEHSIRVAQIVVPELKLHALLHDASEAYIQDISRPLKNLLVEYKRLEENLSETIYAKWLKYRDDAAIKKADNILLVTEGRDLMGGTEDWGLTESALTEQIKPWPPVRARYEFLSIFHDEVNNGNR